MTLDVPQTALDKVLILFDSMEEQFQEPGWFHAHLDRSRVVLEALSFIGETFQIVSDHAKYIKKNFKPEEVRRVESHFMTCLEDFGLVTNLLDKLSDEKDAYERVVASISNLRDELNDHAESVSDCGAELNDAVFVHRERKKKSKVGAKRRRAK